MNQHFMEIFGSVLVALITALFGPVAILWVKKKLTKPKLTLAFIAPYIVVKLIDVATLKPI